MGTAALLVAVVALALAAFAVFYQKQVGVLSAGTDEQARLYTQMTGLNNAASKNVLDPKYQDADGDLVADVPPAAGQVDPPTLKFSYVAVEDDTEFRAAFKELMAALAKATGKPVEYASYASFEDELRALRDGSLQIAGLNTGSVPIGVCVAGFVPVSEMADADGTSGYHMQIIARPDSGISDLKGLRGHELTLTDPSSNSGFKAPLVELRQNNLLPPRDYLIRYSQGHTQSIEGIKAKTFEAAAVAGDVLKRETLAGRIGVADYKAVYQSEQVFPGAALGYAHDLKPETAARIREVLLNFDWKGTGLEKAFAPEGRAKFVPADYKKNWDYVRRIDESFGFNYTLAPAGTQPATQTAAMP